MKILRDMQKMALETGNSFHRGPLWETQRRFVYRDFCEREREREREREVQEGPGNGASLINLIWASFWTQVIL